MTLRPAARLIRRGMRLCAIVAMAAAALISAPAMAQVYVTFHSSEGSALMMRSVHAFIVLSGTLEENGKKIDENYGFGAKTLSFDAFSKPVAQTMMIETPKDIAKTRSHFTVPISDEQYRRIIAMTQLWWHNPEYKWQIDTRNCVSYVGRVGEIAGLKVDFPHELMRRPKAFLNRVAMLNPQLHARQL